MLSESLLNQVIKQICKNLASHEEKSRNKGFKRLQKLISLCNTGSYQIEAEHCVLLLKGLHYWLWSQDKLLNQEHLVDEICGLLPSIQSEKTKLDFISALFETEVREWKTLDKWRTDKFMMLIRRFFRKSVEDLASNEWKCLDSFIQILQQYAISAERGDGAFGMRMHFVNLYLEELSNFEPTSHLWMKFLQPYFKLVPYMPRDHPLMKRVEDIFYLILPPTDDDTEVPLDINFKDLGNFLFQLGGEDGKNVKKLYEWALICYRIVGETPPTELPNTQLSVADSSTQPANKSKKNKRKRKLNGEVDNTSISKNNNEKVFAEQTKSPPRKRRKMESPKANTDVPPSTPSSNVKKTLAKTVVVSTPSPKKSTPTTPKTPASLKTPTSPKSSEKKIKDSKRVSFGKIYRKPFKKKDAVRTPSPGTITSSSAGKGILKKNLLRQSKKIGLLWR